MRRENSLLLLVCVFVFTACRREAAVPAESRMVSEQAQIYPDYREVVVPPNIAPLNFCIQNEGEAFVVSLQGKGKSLCVAADEDGKVRFDTLAWRSLLQASKGADLACTVYARRGGEWLRFPSYTLGIAEEPVDAYLSYRLIEPGYELYRQVGLYQRNVTNFCETVIYENNRDFSKDHNHCVNCHNFQNYSTRRMLFHVRAAHGGTVIADGDRLRKMNMLADSILANAVYPAWHPAKNRVVFSSNQTGQTFHLLDRQKVEVLDVASDLIFFDADRNTVRNIRKTRDTLETFPCWSADGRKLYYCAATLPQLAALPDSLHQSTILQLYDSLRYSVMSLSFDERTGRFGSPVVEVDCAAMGKSASVPRVSPDGRYLLFTLGDFGQFHIWHTSSDLWVKDLASGVVRPLTEANSPDVDSYHAWSSNGRWLVVASRRDDGSYTRLYISYFDRQGNAHKAFMLPQEDPEHNLLLLKSYNVPEFTRDAVRFSSADFRKIIYEQDGIPVRFEGKR